MKRWTIPVEFMWESSDDGMDSNLENDTRYLIPESAQQKREEFFVLREELDAKCTYAFEDEARADYEKLVAAYNKWWSGAWCDDVFPDGMVDEMPDTSPEFIVPLCIEEVDV